MFILNDDGYAVSINRAVGYGPVTVARLVHIMGAVREMLRNIIQLCDNQYVKYSSSFDICYQ
jgi:hypothetical protein